MELAGPLKVICFIILTYTSNGINMVKPAFVPFDSIEACKTYGDTLKIMNKQAIAYDCAVVHHDGSVDITK